jgi:hypothetical protein
MVATLEHLVAVRSQLAEELRDYFSQLVETLDRTPWFRAGEIIRASEIVIPPRVFKVDTTPALPRTARRIGAQTNEAAQSYWTLQDLIGPEVAALYEEPAWLERQVEVNWDEERGHVQRAIVLGAPGGGKSCLAGALVVDLAAKAREAIDQQTVSLEELPLPVHLQVAELANPDLPASPLEAVLALLRQKYRLSSQLEQWLHARLPGEQGWFIMDALDEVNDQHRKCLVERLQTLETQGWQARVLLTCRSGQYDRALLPWARLTEYELTTFHPPEIRQLVERWFGRGREPAAALWRILERNFALRRACRNPLLATLVCLAHQERPITEETRRGDLYARVLRGLARQAWKKKPLPVNHPYVDDLLPLLESVAYKLLEQHPERNLFTRHEITELIRSSTDCPLPRALWSSASPALHPAALAYVPTLLREELHECGLLVDAGLSASGEAQCSFCHRSFLEFLTARGLARRHNRAGWQTIAGLVDRKSWHPAWQETLLLLVGQLADPKPLLEMLRDPAPTSSNPAGDDVFRHRLALAALALTETTPAFRSTHAALVDGITNEVVEVWMHYHSENGKDVVRHLDRAVAALVLVNGRIDGEPLLDWLANQSWDWFAAAIRALRENAATPEILTTLEQLLDQDEESLLAADCIEHIGEKAATPGILARLEKLVKYRDRWTRPHLVRILRKLRPEASLAVFQAPFENFGWEGHPPVVSHGAVKKPEQTSSPSEIRVAFERILSRDGERRSPVNDPRESQVVFEKMMSRDIEMWKLLEWAIQGFGSLNAEERGQLLDQLGDLLGSDRDLWTQDGEFSRLAIVIGRLGCWAATPRILWELIYATRNEVRRNAAYQALAGIMADGVRVFAAEGDRWLAQTIATLAH